MSIVPRDRQLLDALLQPRHIVAQLVHLLYERGNLLRFGQYRMFFGAIFRCRFRQVCRRIVQMLPCTLHGLHDVFRDAVAGEAA